MIHSQVSSHLNLTPRPCRRQSLLAQRRQSFRRDFSLVLISRLIGPPCFRSNAGFTTYIERVLQGEIHGALERDFSFIIGRKSLKDALKRVSSCMVPPPWFIRACERRTPLNVKSLICILSIPTHPSINGSSSHSTTERIPTMPTRQYHTKKGRISCFT